MKLNFESAEAIIAQVYGQGNDTIDLSDCIFADISGIVRLVLIAKHKALSGQRATILVPRDNNVQTYLERANAFQELKACCSLNEPIDHLAGNVRNATKNLVEVRSIEEEGQIRNIVDCFSEHLKGTGVADEARNAIEKILYETLQNIPHHADPEGKLGACNGVVALQKYAYELCLAIGDLGVGIRESLTLNPKFPKEVYDDSKAVLAAANQASRHGDRGRGGGLPSVIQALASVGGTCSIRSGSVVLKINGDSRLIQNVSSFPGTHIDISVPLNRLEIT